MRAISTKRTRNEARNISRIAPMLRSSRVQGFRGSKVQRFQGSGVQESSRFNGSAIGFSEPLNR
jgi:hypothetical protein